MSDFDLLIFWLSAGFVTAAFGWWRCPLDDQPGAFMLAVVVLTWPAWWVLWHRNTYG